MPTLLDALDDPAFFGKHFPASSWTAWRAFCAALYGLPVPQNSLALFRGCTGRQDAPHGGARRLTGENAPRAHRRRSRP